MLSIMLLTFFYISRIMGFINAIQLIFFYKMWHDNLNFWYKKIITKNNYLMNDLM